MKTKIKVKLIDNGYPLEIIDKGDWVDLRVRKPVYMKGLDTTKIDHELLNKEREIVDYNYSLLPLGIAIELPKGYEAIVLPRSSTPRTFGIILANSVGVIDNSYCGDKDEWKFGAIALRDTTIAEGARIAQFRVQLSQRATVWQKLKWLFSSGIEFEFVDSLGNKNRGGIGSTGIK